MSVVLCADRVCQVKRELGKMDVHTCSHGDGVGLGGLCWIYSFVRGLCVRLFLSILGGHRCGS